jgi:crotonobetainyl-CoA:carnitine CoA-transferase CaiB-like acyl-CoA transferase
MTFDLLHGTTVLDLSTELAGPYATKLLVDAGADVVKIEPPSGDPLRRWSASGPGVGNGAGDGALFRFLNAGKRLLVGSIAQPSIAALAAGAEIVVESGQLSLPEIAALRDAHPALVVVSISPFGRTGPWADRPATEFTLQAECGATVGRGLPEREPLHVDGRVGEWVAGVYAALGALAALLTARRQGHGEHVDVSMLESMIGTLGQGSPISASLGGLVRTGPARSRELPSIEPAADGWVAFCTNTAQQFSDFLVLIDRGDLVDDRDLASFPGRWRRRDEFSTMVHAWSRQRTADEAVERATLLRVPATLVGQPGTIPAMDHLVERGVFGPGPDGLGVVPRVPYQVDGRAARPAPGAPTAIDSDGEVDVAWPPRATGPSSPATASPATPSPGTGTRPLAGMRVLDLTSFWAGPLATSTLAALGADVVKVESIQHPDAFRYVVLGAQSRHDAWWEFGVGYQLANVSKRGITLDISGAEGRALFLRLVERCDVVVENYSPRVLENVGLTWDVVHARNPSAIMIRMPAFGLDGPWRERTGFASTIEAVSGLAWRCGYADGPPTTLRGPCDPIAGMHAVFAILAAVHERDRSGRGHFVESSMVEVALNIAAELTLEHSGHGVAVHRDGNRGPGAAPQGVYRCAGDDSWIAVAVTDDPAWRALVKALGEPAWATRSDLDHVAGRRRAHDDLDRRLGEWTSGQALGDVVELLLEHGIPAAPVVDGLTLGDNPQLQARGFFEPIASPLLGEHRVGSLPFRFASRTDPWIRGPAPRLGEHNVEILTELLGLTGPDLDRLDAAGVIGTRPLGA